MSGERTDLYIVILSLNVAYYYLSIFLCGFILAYCINNAMFS
jgi:hypothetical protein